MREIFLFLMLLPFCAQLNQMILSLTAPQPAMVSPTIIGSDTFEGAIFPAGYVSDLDLWMGYTFSDYWTPSETDIYAFEGGIRDFLIQTADPRFYQEPRVWDRQFCATGPHYRGRHHCRATELLDRVGARAYRVARPLCFALSLCQR